MSTPNPVLKALARDIKEAHAAVIQATRQGLLHAKYSGDLLIKARKVVPHGAWDKWVTEECAFSPRLAQMYMHLARNWPRIKAEAKQISDLTINEALALIAKRSTAGHPEHQAAQDKPTWAVGDPHEEEFALKTVALRRALANIANDPRQCDGWASEFRVSQVNELREVRKLIDEVVLVLQSKERQESKPAA